MTKKDAIRLFEDRQVRSVWDSEAEKWYISVVDVIEVLTDSANPRRYWSDLKRKLQVEGSQLYENIVQLKMKSSDGKSYNTDVADTEQLFRLIQSIPSPKAEPFKQWLSQLGRERLEEIDDPEQGIDRLLEYYHRKGYSANWINQRLKSIEVRKELTDEWERRGIQKGQQYAILTDVITQSWSGLTTKQYKRFKGLKTESLRDNMTNLELVLNMLAEASTTEISQNEEPESFEHSKRIAYRGGRVAGAARKELEAQTGQNVVSPLSAKQVLVKQRETLASETPYLTPATKSTKSITCDNDEDE